MGHAMTGAALQHALLQELMAALADGELPSGDARVVREHLRGCSRCQREMAVQQGLSAALAREPAAAASAGLRRRIEHMDLRSPVGLALPWTVWAAPVAAAALLAIVIVGGAAVVSIGVGRAGALIARSGEATSRTAAIPLLRDALADCRRVMGRNFPRKADLQAVGAGLQYPVRALARPDAELFSTWTTTLAGAPAAGLAYRWRGIVVVQYEVPAELIRRQPTLGEALRAIGYYSAVEDGQGIVASLSAGSGTLLLADAPPEVLRRLIL
jgi:Putative zinc-finger